MNICFLSREYPPKIIGGVGIYTYEMAQALTKVGHRVCVITEVIDKEGEFEEEGVFVSRVKSAPVKFFSFLKDKLPMTVERLEYSWSVSKKLKQLTKKYKLDIVESCEARAEGLWYYLLHRNPPLVVKLHTPESIIFRWNHDPYTLDRSIVKKIEEHWIFRADKLIAISSTMTELISRFYKFKFNNVSILPNPINIGPIISDGSFCGFNGDPVVLYTGRLEFRKGVHILIRCVPKVLQEIPTARFIFVGSDCGIKQYLLEKIKEFKCAENVIIMDHIARDKLIDYYVKSSVCVVPSLWENFPYSGLEAMACGKPLIASNAGGLSEIIENGIDGLLVTPGSVDELTRAIIDLLKDSLLAQRLGNMAKEKIVSKYNNSKIAALTLRIYSSFLCQ
jgi:glycosyltransferase involved in cell wall biosynthesis